MYTKYLMFEIFVLGKKCTQGVIISIVYLSTFSVGNTTFQMKNYNGLRFFYYVHVL